MRTILLFIDGFGIGRPDPQANPQFAYGGRLLRLDGAGAAGPVPVDRGGLMRPIDAILGVEGVPQSATGQTTLLSGVNAQAAIGKHLTGFPNGALRAILLEHSILKQLTDRGRRACFLNAFRPRFFDFPRERQLHFSATTVANLAAYLPFFTLDDISAGRSIYQEFTNHELIEMGFPVQPLSPGQAGRVLARQSRSYDFLLFEYFQTDKAGHSQDMARCCDQLARVDAFLNEVLAELAEDLAGGQVRVVLTSDHGNIEDVSTRRHTTNPIPLMVWGRDAGDFLDSVSRLDQVTPAIVARH
jgi:2,3-bisphosphoglycerate-independent phosphoglycerate mutase